MKILWVLPKLTFPTEDGACVASDALGCHIAGLCEQLDVFYYRDEGDRQTDLYAMNWGTQQIFSAQKKKFKSLVSKTRFWFWRFLRHPLTPVSTSVFDSLEARIEFHSALRKTKYDYIVFDGLHTWAMARNLLNTRDISLIYRSHNVESEVWASAARGAKWPLTLFMRFQSRVMRTLEEDLISRASEVWAISAEDAEIFRKINERVSVVPVGMKFSAPKNYQGEKIKLFFLGRMDWGPNRDGIKWFLDEVWPQVHTQRKDIELYIAGSGDSSWLETYRGLAATHFLGRIESVANTYAQMDLAITPIFYGSGTRIKVIESVANGVPLISTRMGVQGSGLIPGDYLQAETASEWIDALVKVCGRDLNLLAHHSSNRLRPLLDGATVATRAIRELADSV